MTGKVVTMYSAPTDGLVLAVNSTGIRESVPIYTPLEVATAVCFMVAVYQV